MTSVTMILVHGALLTSSSWMPVQSYLQNHGHNVVTVDIPGRAADELSPKDVSLQLASEKICKVVNMQAGSVILIGHSQAGAVITQATNVCGARITALVYVAAVVPANGEKAFDMLSEQDGVNFEKVATLDVQSGLYQVNYNGPIKAMFMADATDWQAKHAIAQMVDEPARLGDEALHYDKSVFDTIPKYYILTSEDKIISPATQNKYLARTRFTATRMMTTGHSPFVSQPHWLAQLLGEIAMTYA